MTAEEVGELLKSKGLKLATAESCTGGRLGDKITDVPGSSEYYMGGVVSYSNHAKVDILGVNPKLILTKGAVSEEVAIEMADGARERFHADIGVGITGIAGPSGGSAEKPVGLVYIAVTSEEANTCAKNHFEGARSEVKEQATNKALQMLKDFASREF